MSISNQTIMNSALKLIHSVGVLQAVNSIPLDKESADSLFNLYRRSVEKMTQSEQMKSYTWMSDDFASVESCDYAWEHLDISLPLDEMENVLNETGVLQLRSLDEDSKVLILGCGNCPIANSGGYPLQESEWTKYRNRHKHFKAVTINPHLGFNPCLIGSFGAQQFPMLKTGQFELIVIEGTTLVDTPLGRNELARLLSPKGNIVQNFGGHHGYAFSWEDNAKNAYESGYELPSILIKNLNVFESFNYEESSKKRSLD